MLVCRWSIQLLGAFRVQQDPQKSIRFQTQKTGELLAYLACFPEREHLRDEVMEALWHNVDPVAGRNRLKQTLASLRRQLEPADTPSGTVLIADRLHLSLNEAAIQTDVRQFKTALHAAVRIKDEREKANALATIVALYGGELLPGTYSDWAVQERHVLNSVFFTCLQQLVRILEGLGDLAATLKYAEKLVSLDNLLEETHQMLIRLYLAAGQPSMARRQYQTLERMLAQELGVVPSQTTRNLLTSGVAGASSALSTPQQSLRETQTGSPKPVFPSPPSVGTALRFPDRIVRLEPPAPPDLPVPLTRFIGRQEEISCLLAMLTPQPPFSHCAYPPPLDQSIRGRRLVTIKGPGGYGKTHLALAVADRLQAFYPNAIWFVELAESSDLLPLADLLIDVLRLPRLSPLTPLDQVVEALSRRPSVLLLDGCEQIKSVANIVETLLLRVPTLTCLITSRQQLGIVGEQSFVVGPMPIPETTHPLQELLQCDSVRLFLDRAQTTRSEFRITPENAPIVAELCRKLEGSPLAIELAAAWIPTLGPAQILARLDRRFELLVRQKKGGARHASLHSVISSSYDLLVPDEKQLLTRLSIFRGGWTLEAAMAVADCEEAELLERIGRLRTHSLISTAETQGNMRFRMLESLRECAAEKSAPSPEAQPAPKHAAFFLDFAEQAARHLQGPDQEIWLEKLEHDEDNLRAAIQWLHTQPDGIEAELRLVSALWRYWWMRGLLSEGKEWLTRTLERSRPISSLARAQALLGAAHIAGMLGEYSGAHKQYEECIQVFEVLGKPEELCHATACYKVNARLLQHPNDIDFLQQCVEQSRSFEQKHCLIFCLARQGIAAWLEGDGEQAEALLGESLNISREIGDKREIADVLCETGHFALARGEYPYAQRLLREALTLGRQIKDPGVVARSLQLLGVIACFQGDYETATGFLEESLEIRRRSGERAGVAAVLSDLGKVVTYQSDYEHARSLQETSMAIRKKLALQTDVALTQERLAWIALLQGEQTRARNLFLESLATFRVTRFRPGIAASLYGLGIVNYRRGRPKVAQTLLEESLTYRKMLRDKKGWIDCLEAVAKVHQVQREHPAAGVLLAAASSLRALSGIVLSPTEQHDFDRSVRIAKTAMVQESFLSCWTKGSGMSLEEASAYAIEH